MLTTGGNLIVLPQLIIPCPWWYQDLVFLNIPICHQDATKHNRFRLTSPPRQVLIFPFMIYDCCSTICKLWRGTTAQCTATHSKAKSGWLDRLDHSGPPVAPCGANKKACCTHFKSPMRRQLAPVLQQLHEHHGGLGRFGNAASGLVARGRLIALHHISLLPGVGQSET